MSTELPLLKWPAHFAGYGKDECKQIEALARAYGQQCRNAALLEAAKHCAEAAPWSPLVQVIASELRAKVK